MILSFAQHWLTAFCSLFGCIDEGPSTYRSRENLRLVWSDEFDGLNTSTWQHLITAWRGGNKEFQYYTNRSENSYVKDGALYIRPTLTADRFDEDFLYNGILDLAKEGCNLDWENGCFAIPGEDIINPIQSSRLRTLQSFSFKYGRVDVRAQMPKGDWLWPAIWLLPTENAYGPWPQSGEIDLVELKGNPTLTLYDGQEIGNRMMGSTLHWGPVGNNSAWRKTHGERLLENGSYSSDFHLYSFEWQPSGFTFYVDNELLVDLTTPSNGYWEYGGFNGKNPWEEASPDAPFDRKFHFILNVACGGNFFPDNSVSGTYTKPWKSNDTDPMRRFWESRQLWLNSWGMPNEENALKVDYIRVYEFGTYASGGNLSSDFMRDVFNTLDD